MASLSIIRTVAARSRTLFWNAAQQQQRRNMSLHGHHGPPPEWTGVDKIVRSYFPEDYQLSMAILGGYFGIYLLVKLGSSFSKKAPVVEKAPVVAATESTGVPSVESPAFASFVETSAFEQLLENEGQLAKLVESA